MTKHLLCCEHLELVHGGIEAGVVDCSKACPQILARDSGVWLGGDGVKLQGYLDLDWAERAPLGVVSVWGLQ